VILSRDIAGILDCSVWSEGYHAPQAPTPPAEPLPRIELDRSQRKLTAARSTEILLDIVKRFGPISTQHIEVRCRSAGVPYTSTRRVLIKKTRDGTISTSVATGVRLYRLAG